MSSLLFPLSFPFSPTVLLPSSHFCLQRAHWRWRGMHHLRLCSLSSRRIYRHVWQSPVSMVIPSRNPRGIHHPYSQPARKNERERQAGRENEGWGGKLEAIGDRWENICFLCIFVCRPLLCVQKTGKYRVGEAKRKGWFCVWKRREDHFRAVRLLLLAEENKRQCLGAGGSAHGRRCNLGRLLAAQAPAWISAALAHSHTLTHTRIHTSGWLSGCPKTHKIELHSHGLEIIPTVHGT